MFLFFLPYLLICQAKEIKNKCPNVSCLLSVKDKVMTKKWTINKTTLCQSVQALQAVTSCAVLWQFLSKISIPHCTSLMHLYAITSWPKKTHTLTLSKRFTLKTKIQLSTMYCTVVVMPESQVQCFLIRTVLASVKHLSNLSQGKWKGLT